MDVDSRLDMSLEDIIKKEKGSSRSTKLTAKTSMPAKKGAAKKTEKPRGGKGVVARKTKGAKTSNARVLTVQRPTMKKAGKQKQQTAKVQVQVRGGRNSKQSQKRVPRGKGRGEGKPKLKMPDPKNLQATRVHLKNDKARQQPVQRVVYAYPAAAAQQLYQQPQPSYGYGPRNLMPREAYVQTAAAAPSFPVPRRRTASDYGVSQRILGGGGVVPTRRQVPQFIDYDQGDNILRMDYRS